MMRIDHVRLLPRKFAECFRFYRDVIGLTVKWGTEEEAYASFAEPGQTVPNLALFRRQEMADALGIGELPAEAAAQDRCMMIIGVEDLDATVERIQALGVQFTLEPRNYPAWGMRAAYLRDPDGNLIELSGELPPEQWTPELRAAAQQYNQYNQP
jgi:catechol 2,3-dioxygenase-like lactoylglutathione lyase family enzyme